jgi:outer membrane protein assembly factor BamB
VVASLVMRPSLLVAGVFVVGCHSSPPKLNGGAGRDGATATAESVLTRNGHETRDAFFIQPTLTKAAAARFAPDANFEAPFTGVLYGAPLYMENGPGGKGAFFVATTNNDVTALDEATGRTLWMHNIGAAPGKTGAGCGNVAPTGITSTPVIDAASRTIFVAGAIGDANGIMRHEVHALGVDDGLEKPGWPVNVSAMTGPGAVTFNSPPQNQRSALSLVRGILYVPYGGHAGDCGDYRGWVVAVDITKPARPAAWVTGGVGEAIWAAGGMASDGDGVFAVTGNNIRGATAHADSEEVVHVTGMGQVDRATGIFFPGTWRAMDQVDADFGSSSPVVIHVPGATPSSLLAAVTKNGHFYLLDAATLGGMDGQLVHLNVAPPETAMSIRAALAAYTSTTGVHVVFNAANTSAYCPPTSKHLGLVSILVGAAAPPTGTIAWCSAGGDGSPAATSTDGTNDTVVWHMNGTTLTGDDGDTGDVIYSGGACTGVPAWSTPIAVKGHIIVGGANHLCSWSPQ